MRLAQGTQGTRIEEDALDKGGGDEGRILEAALGRGDRVAGVRDEPLGSIVERCAGANERLHAPKVEEIWLILESTLKEFDGSLRN